MISKSHVLIGSLLISLSLLITLGFTKTHSQRIQFDDADRQRPLDTTKKNNSKTSEEGQQSDITMRPGPNKSSDGKESNKKNDEASICDTKRDCKRRVDELGENGECSCFSCAAGTRNSYKVCVPKNSIRAKILAQMAKDNR